MTEPKQRAPSLGQQLFAAGWRQGALFNESVAQILIHYDREEPPFDLRVVLLVEAAGLSADAATATARVRQELAGALDPAIVGPDLGWDLMTTETMSIAHYAAMTPVALDYFTYQGDQIVGAPPPPSP